MSVKHYVFYRSDFVDAKLKLNKSEYLFNMSVTGEFGNRQLYLSTGYRDYDDYTNHFVLSLEDAKKMKSVLDKTIEQIEEDAACKNRLDKYRQELKGYIEKGFVEKIIMIKENIPNPSGFNKSLYTPFTVKPVFTNIDGNNTDNVNLFFNYTEFFHLSPNDIKFQEMIDYIRWDHKEIPIEFKGYDRKAHVKKSIEDAKRSLKNYNPKDNVIPHDYEKEVEAFLKSINKK